MINRRQLLTAAGAAAFDASSAYSVVARNKSRLIELDPVSSNYISPSRVMVWLPYDYDISRKQYSVVYMHDGQNLFDPARSNFNKVWAADKSAERLLGKDAIEPFIIVGIDHPGPDRSRQYLPQGILDRLPSSVRAKLAGQSNGKAVISNQYLQFIVDELRPIINRRFRTRTDRRHTAIVGSSMGGLISLYAIARYPSIFGNAAAVSTHWPLAAPEWTDAEREQLFVAWREFIAHDLGKPAGRRIWFDHGTETLDSYYRPYQNVVDAALVENGWEKGRSFSSRVYVGAAHEENAWAARMDDIFLWLFGKRR
jgi:predicted alpha/beta superfamily hydrolase